MSVQAKFYVAEKTEFAYNTSQKHVVLRPVTRGDENRDWAAATPSGELKMQINNAAAAEQFHIGQEFLLTFEPVPKAL